jgi:hypothetical protein
VRFAHEAARKFARHQSGAARGDEIERAVMRILDQGRLRVRRQRHVTAAKAGHIRALPRPNNSTQKPTIAATPASEAKK